MLEQLCLNLDHGWEVKAFIALDKNPKILRWRIRKCNNTIYRFNSSEMKYIDML